MIFLKKGQNPSFLSTCYVNVTEEEKCLFVDKVVPENAASHAANGKLLVNHSFSRAS